MQFLEISYDDWFDTYKPITNHIEKNASFDGCMFETYGDEVAFVKAQDENRIWMYGDGDDGGTYIWSGWGFVNRIGYFITEVPCPDNLTIQVSVSDVSEVYICDNCGAEWEDDSALLMQDTLAEIGKCAGCATIEEIQEYSDELDTTGSI
jgi:hypothetical protein